MQVTEPRVNQTGREILRFLENNPPFTSDQEKFQLTISAILSHLPLSDVDNAIRLASRFGYSIRYVAEQKTFYVWTGKRWEEDKKGYVSRCAKTTASYLTVEAMYASENGEKHRADDLLKWFRQSRSRRGIESMIELLKSEIGISVLQNDLDVDDYLFNVENGTLNLQTGLLKPHDPLDLITKLAPVIYDPEAQCPSWNKFMYKICRGSRQLFDFHQDLAGCGLVGKQLDDILPINFGPGGNGKGIYAETIKAVYGDYAATATSDLFLAQKNESISNDRARLAGVRFLTASETEEGRRLNEALVKSLTGGDAQTARFLHKEFFEFTPKFTALLFTNHKPIIHGTDQGIWRRVKLVPWLHDFTRDPEVRPRPEVMAELRAESSGILNWAVAGYVRRRKTSQIVVPTEILGETDEYRRQSDTMGEFLEDHCIVTEEHARVEVSTLYEAYAKFIGESGQKNIANKRTFSLKLMERTDIPYLGKSKSGSIRYWTGIRLRDESDNEEKEVF